MTASKNLYLGKPAAFQVMIKPIGSKCNLNCAYCYYLEKEKLYKDHKSFILNEDVLEQFIKQNIELQEVPLVQFLWQGGEPTMLPIDYYKKALEFQEKYAGKKRIENIFQTNGTLLDDEWCRFFKLNNFLIGISIDGPKELHDRYRVDRSGKPTWEKVMNSIQKLKDFGVEFNTLSVINDVNSKHPLDVYQFLKEIGSQYMQFIPIVEQIADDVPEHELSLVFPEYLGDAHLSPWSVEPRAFGNFLIQIFDEWVRKDVASYFVQQFDAALANWIGEMPGLCVYSKICGEGPCLEHNGDLYACDHFVYPEYYLGNIMEKNVKELAKSDTMIDFGQQKEKSLPLQCIECKYRFACNGGCPKNRISVTNDGEKGLNYLCEGYYNFFNHVHPYMQYMADQLAKRKPPANVMDWVKKMDFKKSIRASGQKAVKHDASNQPTSQKKTIQKVGRNAPCPCGSGKKSKNCCYRKR